MYASLTVLQKSISASELLRLTDDLGVDVIDETVVDAAIVAAGDQVDTYLGEVLSLPIVPTPGIVESITTDLAIYILYGRSFEGPTEHWEKRYTNAIKILERIASGDIGLGVDDPNPDGDEAIVSGPNRIFSRPKMEGF